MSRIRERLPVSPANTLIACAILIGAVIAALQGNVAGAFALLGAAVFWVGVARYARRATARDRDRIGTFEYRDARDRALGSRAFAGVGVVALAWSGLDVIGMVATGHNDGTATIRFLVLIAAFSIALANALEKEHPEP
ncbi:MULTISPECIES: hypothetical protein [Cryobacterium]|uniref:DUF2178 domain-containing protein n=1 Tax=Cryobacterium glucosi TaxID=1259175 RepID=A0ABY2IS50_9MICO|nr:MULTISPECIES: hypothetical protein [Cryobacterium]MDY7527441.1 hypothetical protein [Cryobacterium sp. 10C2]MDY7556772.1 hypothetical protein [Cryobacterium sp. 10C3]MEB0002729.1 hypothetical protein [Cryobacterium sp. RTC2.1]MEB0291403.1 hypothetical protein [Cryobacterium sp. 10C2]TFB95252.1 hypothetical protein E3O39_13830 [Cryobacterium sp. MDB2-A-1]